MTLEEALAAAVPDENLITNDIFEINETTRKITIPDSEKLFGVENDNEGERKYFRVPRYVGDNIDLTKSEVYINYRNANGEKDKYHVEDLQIDPEDQQYVKFTWLLRPKVTTYKGNTMFLIYVQSGSKKWNTELATGTVVEGLEVDATEEEKEETRDYLVQLKKELLQCSDTQQSAIEEKGQKVLKEIPDDYSEMSESVKTMKADMEHLKENVGESLKPADVQNAVDKYMESNTVDGMFTPDNMVLLEETDEDNVMTEKEIIGEILETLELRPVSEEVLGLYVGETLVSSIKLQEFKTNEVICTGLTMNLPELKLYGKATIELVATATPQDCTQKVRWLTSDEEAASVTAGTVTVTGKAGQTTITAVCGNYKATCVITVEAYKYNEFNWQIGQIAEVIGAAFQKTEDSQKMRISSDYILTPVDTVISMTAGTGYYYQLYKYKDDKLSEAAGWVACTGTIDISSEECSGFALKVRKGNYGAWSDTDIENFAPLVTIQQV